jgi:hypothetical protein
LVTRKKREWSTVFRAFAIGTISLRAIGYVSSYSIGVGLKFVVTKVPEAHLTDLDFLHETRTRVHMKMQNEEFKKIFNHSMY